MNLCPSYKNLILTKDIETSNDNTDDFISNRFDLIDDEKTAHIKKIRANTPYPFSMLLLGCHNWKDKQQNYCSKLFNSQAVKKACETNKSNYIFFYIKRWFEEKSKNKPNDAPMYILAFVRYSGVDEEIHKKVTTEIKRTVEWLGISGNIIQCYIFYYTTTYQCYTFDRGTLKKKYENQCMDQKYIFQFQYVPPIKKTQYLSVNGGSPKFTIEVQEEEIVKKTA